jgi:hypothetical protein
MATFVLWSFVIALTPVAVGLTWKLIAGAADWVVTGFPHAPEDSGRWWATHP